MSLLLFTIYTFAFISLLNLIFSIKLKKHIQNKNRIQDKEFCLKKFNYHFMNFYLVQIIVFSTFITVMIGKLYVGSSEVLLKSFIHANYKKEITVEDIHNVFSQNNEPVEVLELKTSDVYGTELKRIYIKVRKGSFIYKDTEYDFLSFER